MKIKCSVVSRMLEHLVEAATGDGGYKGTSLIRNTHPPRIAIDP